jgi:hypothetical protein
MQNIPVELALSQSANLHRQLASFADVPSIMLQATLGHEHLLDAAVHTKPVPFPSPLLVHAAFPQMQGELSSALLGADPSVILQAEAVMPEARNEPSLLHVLSAAMQNIPVVPDPVHAALPQMQGALSSALLGADPSVILQAEAVTPEARNEPSLLHVLSAAMQNIPVVPDPVHAALPQMQGALSSALLGADPSVILQAGAVRVQMHVREVEQGFVEEVSLLNHREIEDIL